jgi:cell division protein FtsZ
MIPFERTRQQTIPHSSVKIIGVGGAGANMLDRVALDGMDGAELLALNTDMRTLTSSVSAEKVQLGRNLTKGLGTGGDPDLGRQAAGEAELEIRDSLRDRKIVFICVGLGGGTGSGAAPLIARLAREEGAFTVVFATMPFAFEGRRRREQAGTSLNELAVLSNALVTFDNGRMGDLVLAKQGVHEAFAAADRMVSEAIRAVTRIVMRPGLVNIGLDDLVAALSSNRSRCLFGSGIAEGENRAQQALKNALVSPLLDRGSLLTDAQTVLVHICGGEDLTLYEIELLMQGLSKHVPDTAQLLFGTAVDPAMGESLSVTLVSSLPEEKLQAGTSSEIGGEPPMHAGFDDDDTVAEHAPAGEEPQRPQRDAPLAKAAKPAPKAAKPPVKEVPPPPKAAEPVAKVVEPVKEKLPVPIAKAPEQMEEPPAPAPLVKTPKPMGKAKEVSRKEKPPQILKRKGPKSPPKEVPEPVETREETPYAEPASEPEMKEGALKKSVSPPVVAGVSNLTRRGALPPRKTATKKQLDEVFSAGPDSEEEDSIGDDWDDSEVQSVEPVPIAPEVDPEEEGEVVAFATVEPGEGEPGSHLSSIEELQAAADFDPKPQGELLLEGGPKGRFEGEEPNLVAGEDLDIPPFLRRKK